MSWQRGQEFGAGAQQPFVALATVMGAAAFAAANKPWWEAQLQEALRRVGELPADIDFAAFVAGVARYVAIENELGPRVARVEYPEMARVGRVCLRDAGGEGAAVVLVPSLINRGYVLDLLPGHSLVAHLRAAGHRVLVVDWGEPVVGQELDLEQVIVGHLEPLLRAAVAQVGPVGLVGYCMGGLLALAAAVRLGPNMVSRVALVAVPWDFANTASAAQVRQARPILAPWLAAEGGLVPAAALAQYFWSLDPWGPIRRLMAFGREQERARLVMMTALEDWLADGIALEGPVARGMLVEWYDENRPMLGRWVVGGVVITPRALAVPLWVAVSQRDVLVPPASALGLVAQANSPMVLVADCGHVGLMCGRRAESLLYRPLVEWLRV